MVDVEGLAEEGYLELIRSRGSMPPHLFPPVKHDKLIGRDHVKALGFRFAKEWRRFDRLDDIDIDGLSAPFVLKPTFLSTSHGVFLLRETGSTGVYYDDRYDCVRTMDEIIGVLSQRAAESDYVKKRWIVEERITDVEGSLVPEDVKFFCFYGEVGLIQVVQRNGSRNRVAFFDGDFRPLSTGLSGPEIVVNPNIVELSPLDAPPGAMDLLEAARRISSSLPTPFVRVDLYNTSDGPVFGEFTFTPGTFYYEDREVMSNALSLHLGGLWRSAERRILEKRRPTEDEKRLLGPFLAGERRWTNRVELRTGAFAPIRESPHA